MERRSGLPYCVGGGVRVRARSASDHVAGNDLSCCRCLVVRRSERLPLSYGSLVFRDAEITRKNCSGPEEGLALLYFFNHPLQGWGGARRNLIIFIS